MKRVLVVYYSQTGQLRRVAESLCAPMSDLSELRVDWCPLVSTRPVPFPWPFWKFFDQFPETVHGVAPALQPLSPELQGRYDLVILAYTVWFLSPAPPITAFLKSSQGAELLRDTPVVTLIACRNMWHLAQEQTKALLALAGARLSDNIVLTDAGPSYASFVTTPRWMLTGRREAFWGLPRAGLSEAQIEAAGRFGRPLAEALIDGRLDGCKPALTGLAAVEADVRLLPSEIIGRRSFLVWGRLIMAIGPQGSLRRRPVLLVYVVFLVTMILTIVPVTMALRALLRPLAARRQAEQRAYFEAPSGSGRERMSARV